VRPDARAIAEVTKQIEDAANGGIRREPELPDHVAIVKEPNPVPPPAQEFDITEDDADDAARQAQVRRTMQAGIARQVSLDPGDDMNL
jgi:type IV secretion system protein VirD4